MDNFDKEKRQNTWCSRFSPATQYSGI